MEKRDNLLYKRYDVWNDPMNSNLLICFLEKYCKKVIESHFSCMYFYFLNITSIGLGVKRKLFRQCCLVVRIFLKSFFLVLLREIKRTFWNNLNYYPWTEKCCGDEVDVRDLTDLGVGRGAVNFICHLWETWKKKKTILSWPKYAIFVSTYLPTYLI